MHGMCEKDKDHNVTGTEWAKEVIDGTREVIGEQIR